MAMAGVHFDWPPAVILAIAVISFISILIMKVADGNLLPAKAAREDLSLGFAVPATSQNALVKGFRKFKQWWQERWLPRPQRLYMQIMRARRGNHGGGCHIDELAGQMVAVAPGSLLTQKFVLEMLKNGQVLKVVKVLV